MTIGVRDRHGLLHNQRLLLQELARTVSWGDACESLGLPRRQFARWMRSDAAFRAAYDKLYGEDNGETVRKQVAASAAKAADVLDAALDATKRAQIVAMCPNCQFEFVIDATNPDWPTRLAAMNTALRVGGQLKDVTKIEGEIVHMTLEHKLALAALKSGRSTDQIPPHILDDLRAMKALPPGKAEEIEEAADATGEIAAEFHEILEEGGDAPDTRDEFDAGGPGLQP